MAPSLSRRETQVRDLVVEGHANKVIAIMLHISCKTVESHRARVMEKYEARSLVDLVKKAWRPDITDQSTHTRSPMKPYTKLDAELKALPDDATEFAAVLVHKTDTIFAAIEVKGGESLNHADAKKAVKGLKHCGAKGWRLPELHELEAIRDLTRCNPAVDVSFFPFVQSRWYWTDTKFAGLSGCSWVVAFYYGYSYWSLRGNHGRALAVRSARQ